MTKIYNALPTVGLAHYSSYVQPPEPPEVTHIDDSALSVMVDFKYHKHPTIHPEQPLAEAIAEMKMYNMPVLLVVDTDRKVLGIITSEDALGEKPVKLIQERRILRTEIEVAMIMIPSSEIAVIDIEDLPHTKVGHIIQTFRELKQHNLLVVKIDSNTRQQSLRGLFSASLISKQLDKDITAMLEGPQSPSQPLSDLL